jgi:tetratricopeptide (TPR) repeat protein
MATNSKSKSRLLSGPECAYLATLLIFFAASFFPETRLWGVNVWAYFPIWVRFALLGVGLLALVVVRKWGSESVRGNTDTPQARSGQFNWLEFTALLIAFGMLFYLLRARTHFLGDGYTLLSMLADEKPLIKTRGLGEGLAHLWVKSLIGGDARQAALLSYQVISIGAGLAFLATILLSARVLFTPMRDRILFALGIGSGGYMLLFFGYVENYSLFCLSILMFALTGVLASRGKLTKWLIILPLGLSVFFHVLGVTLIPAAVYLLVAGTPAGDRLARMGRGMKWGLAGVLVVASATVFGYFYSTDYFFRFAFVPPLQNQFTVDGYTLFSAKHLLDYLNLVILLVPGVLVLITALPTRAVRELLRRVEMRFLLVLVVCTLGAAFIFDPKLGMPRDWDLFSFPGVPVAVLLAMAMLYVKERAGAGRHLLALFALMGWLALVPRAETLANVDRSIVQLRSYYGIDVARSAPVRSNLIEHLASLGRLDEAARESELSARDYPEGDTLDAARSLFAKGKAGEAIRLCRFVIRRNPTLYGGWLLEGMCYNQLGDYDSAIHVLDIADGLNPHNAQTCEEIAVARFATRRFSGVEALFLEARAADSTRLRPLLGLAALYQTTGRRGEFVSCFNTIIRRNDAPAEYLRMAADELLAQGRFDQAAILYRRALRAGLDSAYIKSLATKYPQLKGIL